MFADRSAMLACCLVVGVMLQLQGLGFLYVAVAYIALGWVKPRGSFELLVVAAVKVGVGMFQVSRIFVSTPGAPTTLSQNIEPIAIALVCLVLVVTQNQLCAWCLLIYIAAITLLLVWYGFSDERLLIRHHSVLPNIILNLLMAALLISWIAKPKAVAAEPKVATLGHEPS